MRRHEREINKRVVVLVVRHAALDLTDGEKQTSGEKITAATIYQICMGCWCGGE